MKKTLFFLAALVLVTAACAQTVGAPLTNQDVVQMSQAGLPAGVIEAKIGASRCAFDTSTAGLLALKGAAVPSEVIAAVAASRCAAAVAANPNDPASPHQSQAASSPPSWVRTPERNQLQQANYLQFSLKGTWLTPPRRLLPGQVPTMIVRCVPSTKPERIPGNFGTAYIFVGAVVDAGDTASGDGVAVQFRLDNGKLQSRTWSQSTDLDSIFFDEVDFATLVYDHFLVHRANSSPPVHTVIVGVDQFMGSQIVMQFDMPDPTEMANACGLIRYPKKVFPGAPPAAK